MRLVLLLAWCARCQACGADVSACMGAAKDAFPKSALQIEACSQPVTRTPRHPANAAALNVAAGRLLGDGDAHFLKPLQRRADA